MKRILVILLTAVMLLGCVGTFTSCSGEKVNETGTEAGEGKLNAENVFIPETVYPTNEVVVALVDVTKAPYNADNTGKVDATDAINQALADVAEAGGGTVWMPVGQYRVSKTISIPPYCTLHGDWQDPDTGTDYGTVICAYVSADGSDTDDALFFIGGSAGVNGLTVFYPEQSLTDVKSYPYTFYTNGQGDNYMLSSVMNCTVINGYQGIGACVSGDNAHEMYTIDNVKGTFLRTAAEVYNQADVGTWKLLTVSTKYWAECPLDSAKPTLEALTEYTRKNTIGLILGDLEWTEFAGLYISDCKYGVQTVKGRRIEFAGSFFDAIVKDCDIALKVDCIDNRWGMTVVNSELRGSKMSVVNKVMGSMVKMVNVNAPDGTKGAVEADGTTDTKKYSIDYTMSYTKPNAQLFVFTGDRTGASDVSSELQALLTQAGENGGVVYLPGGFYRLDHEMVIPKGVELRGCAGAPTRDQAGATRGTVLLAYYGDGPTFNAKSTALITLEQNAGVNGVRIVFPKNGPLDKSLDTCYAIRGNAPGVYCVNSSIAAAAYGLDFSKCDNHFIKKLVTGCYYNSIRVGGNGGIVEGCLNNGTVVVRCGASVQAFVENWIPEEETFEKYFPVTQKKCDYLIISDGKGEQIYNTFAYGPAVFIKNEGATDTVAINVGSDNIGKVQLVVDGGSLAVMGALRYNGSSYRLVSGTIKMYARLGIYEIEQRTLVQTK